MYGCYRGCVCICVRGNWFARWSPWGLSISVSSEYDNILVRIFLVLYYVGYSYLTWAGHGCDPYNNSWYFRAWCHAYGLAIFLSNQGRFDVSIGCKFFTSCFELELTSISPLKACNCFILRLNWRQINTVGVIESQVWLPECDNRMEGTAALLSEHLPWQPVWLPFTSPYTGRMTSGWRLGSRLLPWVSKINYPRSLVSVYFVHYVHVCRV